MKKKIALGFITYGPANNFLNRLKKVAEQNFNIYIFDNSPSNPELRTNCLDFKNINYLTAGKNLGLGFGLSIICAQAFYEENEALLFFDQDTVFNDETIEFIEAYYIKNINLFKDFSAVTFSAPKKSRDYKEKYFKKVQLTLNSGSLFILKNLEIIGWHNEKFFVDGVDYEFCLNSNIHGFSIGSYINTPGLDHMTEQEDKPYRLFGKTYLWRAYPKFRLIDTIKSSFKLIYTALASRRHNFAKIFIKFLIVYIIIQIAARIINPMNSKKI